MMSEAVTVLTTSQFMRGKQLPSRIKSKRMIGKIEQMLDWHTDFVDGNKPQSERAALLAEIVS